MLKAIGSICILGAGVMIRTYQIQNERRELRTLHDLISALEEMENEIRMNRTPLPRLLRKVGKKHGEDAGVFFDMVSTAVSAGEPLPAAWRSMAVELPISLGGQADVAELGEKLCCDEEGTCKAILLVTSCLTKRFEEKRALQADFEKRCTALCLSGAALLIILLI